MATVTASLATAGAPVKMNHAGTTTVHVKLNTSGNTLSDIMLLAKIPQRALVTDVRGTLGTSNADTVIKLGWKGAVAGTASNETAFGTHTASGTDVVTNFAMTTEDLGPVLVTFTDSTGSNFAYLFATASVGTFSDTVCLDVTMEFTMDHNEGVA